MEPSTSRERARSVEPSRGPRFALRFEAGGGVLVLAHPLRFSFGTIDALELSLGSLRFPLDVRAGAARFRSRRTRVVRASVRLDLRALVQRRLEPPQRLGALAPSAEGIAWALTDELGTIAFDTRVRAEGPDLWVLVEHARSAGRGPTPPLVRAFSVARALGFEHDEESGVLRVPRVLGAALMEALVPHGWRVPDDRGLRLAVKVLGRHFITLETSDEGAPEPVFDPEPWERARRLAPIVQAFLRGEPTEARRAAEALHERLGAMSPALAREVAMLFDKPVEGDEDPSARTVALRRALRDGDADEAVRHARALAEIEPCDAIAVEALVAAADLAKDPVERAALLDMARARRPRDERLALRALEALAQVSDAAALQAAIGAALEGREPGPERAALARDAAAICDLAGQTQEADRLFRLAERWLPDDPAVLEGVARAYERAGESTRAQAAWDRAAHVLAESDADSEVIARALVRAGCAAERANRLEVAEERLARAAERAQDPETWAALARVRRAMGAAGSAVRAEDRLLETISGIASGQAPSSVIEALTVAARVAMERDDLVRARSFADALARVGGADADLRHELDALARARQSETPPPTEVGSPDAPLSRARRAASARDTAELRAALRAAERAGDLDAARAIVRLALEVVGEGPARRSLEEARRRLG